MSSLLHYLCFDPLAIIPGKIDIVIEKVPPPVSNGRRRAKAVFPNRLEH